MPPHGSAVQSAEIDLPELLRIEAEWSGIWRASGRSPFQSPAWLIPWIRHVEPQTTRALAVRRDGRLLAIVPFFAPDGGSAWLLAGAGNSDHLDVAAAPGSEDDVRDALRQCIARHDDRPWMFTGLPLDSMVSHRLAPPRWSCTNGACEPMPYLPIPAGARAVEEVLPPRMRQNLRYYRRRAEAQGIVSFELATESTLAPMLEDLFALHSSRWSRVGESGVLRDERVLAFLREAAPRLLRAGILRLAAMRIGERTVSSVCMLVRRGRWMYYIGGFEPEARASSPGTLAIGFALECAVQEGARELDFLRGAEDYKYRWGAVDRRSRALTLFPPGWRSGS